MTTGIALPRSPPSPSATPPVRRSAGGNLLPVVVLSGCFVASRVGFWLAGVRFDRTPLIAGSEQLLGVRLLKGQLIDSVWHLHSQPPLFNLYCGAILHLPGPLQTSAAWVSFMAIGLAMVIATYLLLVELRVSTALAVVVGLVMIVSPTGVLYENWLFYAYPSAAALAVAALFCARYLRTKRWPYGLGFFVCVCGLALTDSIYQPIWVLAVVVLLGVVMRRHLRQVVAVAAVPVLLLSVWMVKDAVLFGTDTTSSWTGMNLANLTLVPAARNGQLRQLVREGTVTRLALVGPWKPVSAYVPRFVPEQRTGVAALDDRFSNPGFPNFNNIAYVRVSSLLLADDLRSIEHDPGDYLRQVAIGAGVWLTPADQYPFVYRNWLAIHPLVDVFDSVVGWQADQAPGATTAFRAIDGHGPPASQISYSTVVVYLVALLGTPLFVGLRRRRLGRNTVGVLVLMWGTSVYTFAAASLADIAENNRLRFELGPYPLVLAVVVCLWSLETWTSPGRRGSRWWRRFGLSAPGGLEDGA